MKTRSFAISFGMPLYLTLIAALFAVLAPQSHAQSDDAAKKVAENAAKTAANIKSVLRYKPKQDVDYDIPPADMKCELQTAQKVFKKSGYILADNTNRYLRVVLDQDGDKTIDYFSYYKDGIEVYREIDTNFDGKLDNFRWLGSEGTRWGVDRNQDGEIDQWKYISAEEVAYEVFMSIKTRDDNRFRRLLITGDEFKSLGLSGKIAEDAKTRLAKAQSGFAKMVRSQNAISETAKWINSGNARPNLAAKNDQIGKDLEVHDHASSVFETKAGASTLALGSMVKVGNLWRIVELPQVLQGKSIENGGLFFPVSVINQGGVTPGITESNDALAKLYTGLTDLEGEIDSSDAGAAMVKLQEKRALKQWEIYRELPEAEKAAWLSNIADTVSNAYERELYPEGLKFLERIMRTLQKHNKPEKMDYIRWRMINSDYHLGLQEDSAREKEKAVEKYFEELQAFVKEFPKSEKSAKALFNIGQNFEVSRTSDPDKAAQWYKSCAERYPASDYGKRAAGAFRRIKGEGKKIPFAAVAEDGRKFDVGDPRHRGKIVVVYFWEVWSSELPVNAKRENAFEVFADLKSKYKDDVVFASANIENTTAAYKAEFSGDLKGMIKLHSPGGMEKSPLAVQLGMVSGPMMAVWDQKGNLYRTDSGVGDLDRMVQRLQRK